MAYIETFFEIKKYLPRKNNFVTGFSDFLSNLQQRKCSSRTISKTKWHVVKYIALLKI